MEPPLVVEWTVEWTDISCPEAVDNRLGAQ